MFNLQTYAYIYIYIYIYICERNTSEPNSICKGWTCKFHIVWPLILTYVKFFTNFANIYCRVNNELDTDNCKKKKKKSKNLTCF